MWSVVAVNVVCTMHDSSSVDKNATLSHGKLLIGSNVACKTRFSDSIVSSIVEVIVKRPSQFRYVTLLFQYLLVKQSVSKRFQITSRIDFLIRSQIELKTKVTNGQI